MAIEGAGPKVQTIGYEVLDFSLADLEGSARSLHGELVGQKAAVVVFWSCVCSHCQRYDEYLNTFRERHPDIALLAVASRQQETPDGLRRAALALGRGGVGYYPHSDFIHVDTGRVRQWCFDCPASLITGD